MKNNQTEDDLLGFSPKQKLAIDLFRNGKNIFVTGGAGTGKSHLISFLKKKYVQHLDVTASTGIAAVNVGGSTIHSWSGIGIANLPVEQIIQNILSPKFTRVRKRIRYAKALAIDEISMISAETLDMIDLVFQSIRGNKKPMGGLQILLFGDFLQLPPISPNGSYTRFCFHSKAWKSLDLQPVILDEEFRQKDSKLIEILQDLRLGIVDEKIKEILESRILADDENKTILPTVLTTHNFRAEKINQGELLKNKNQEFSFNSKYSGLVDKITFLKKNSIFSESLKLKIGAQVMMIKNTYQKDGVINGSLGIVRDFSKKKSYPIVEFANGALITVTPEEWTVERFDHEKNAIVVDARAEQIPLILAWAITIHKSQGLTIDKISCDLADVFSPGQVYVALSRARLLSGIFIQSIDFNKISANKEAIEFYKKINQDSGL